MCRCVDVFAVSCSSALVEMCSDRCVYLRIPRRRLHFSFNAAFKFQPCMTCFARRTMWPNRRPAAVCLPTKLQLLAEGGRLNRSSASESSRQVCMHLLSFPAAPKCITNKPKSANKEQGLFSSLGAHFVACPWVFTHVKFLLGNTKDLKLET
jgi:hypothetical protein